MSTYYLIQRPVSSDGNGTYRSQLQVSIIYKYLLIVNCLSLGLESRYEWTQSFLHTHGSQATELREFKWHAHVEPSRNTCFLKLCLRGLPKDGEEAT